MNVFILFFGDLRRAVLLNHFVLLLFNQYTHGKKWIRTRICMSQDRYTSSGEVTSDVLRELL